MGVSIFYNGRLAKGKTVDELVSHLEAIAKQKNYEVRKVDETFQFKIPKKVIKNPDASHWYYTNKERILRYAKEAGLQTKGRSHEELCAELNSTQFRQIGMFLWAYERAEPLRFLFVEGGSQLTELAQDELSSQNRDDEPIHYVRFENESLSTKTGYEDGPKGVKGHKEAIRILNEVNDLFFDSKLEIHVPD